MVHAILQQMERHTRGMLRIQGNIKTGLRERQAKQFALAWAVFDQESGGGHHHTYKRTSAGNVPGLKMKRVRMEW